MPDQKLSQLTSATTVAGSDQLYIVQGGQSKRATASQLPISTATAAALDGKEVTGTAATAITAHLAAVDHTSVTLGATVADVLGLTGQQLTADDPGAGADRLLFWDHSAGRLRYLALGPNLTITDTTITAPSGGGGGGYPAFSAPTGFNVGGSGTASITLSFATGYSLPTTANQASWDAAAGLAATAIQPTDSRLTDARDWSAATVTQEAAQAGTETTRRAWTVERVWQAVAAWWQSISGATGRSLAGTSTAAAARTVLELGTAATTDATAYAAASHNQSASTITGLASVATSGTYTDLSGRPTLGTAAALNAGTAAGNVPILDSSALIPSALLPGFVDDVLEFASLAAFPVTGEAGKLYINLATNRQYRWSGSTYAEINPSPGSTDAVPEGSVNLYHTSARGQSAASSWWSGYRSTVGDQLATAASQATARSVIGAGTVTSVGLSLPAIFNVSNPTVTTSGTLTAALANQSASVVLAGPATGSEAAPAFRALVGADLPVIGDGLILVISNRGETSTASTNYTEVPVPVPSGGFTLVAVRFGCHIDTTGSSSTTFNAYRRTAAGVKTSVLTANATLASAASLVDASATITGGTFSAGDRVGVDLVGVGTGAQGLFAQFLFTRSAT